MKFVALLLAVVFTNAASFRICSFNVQSFGEAKVAKPEVMDVIVKVVSRCDIMLLMEIKDSTSKVINTLMAKLNRLRNLQIWLLKENLISHKGLPGCFCNLKNCRSLYLYSRTPAVSAPCNGSLCTHCVDH